MKCEQKNSFTHIPGRVVLEVHIFSIKTASMIFWYSKSDLLCETNYGCSLFPVLELDPQLAIKFPTETVD